MIIEESNLKFCFSDEVSAIKFDDTDYYRKKFNNLPSGKGVDILVDSENIFQFIEIKNCTGHERENLWRTSVNNSKISSAPETLEIGDRDSVDIEVAKKVASTISCLFGLWTKSKSVENSVENSLELLKFYGGMNDKKICKDKKRILVILFLEGDFNVGTRVGTRSKKTIMKRIKDSIKNKLSWLNCTVTVVDSNTYNKRFFEVIK
ncbi:MAG: DUF6661 family protein [Acutalibacteraceae bacterium]|nr:DUF6661 family protein [Acutalibacteraceae bacterium]